MDNHKGLDQTASSISATPNISLGSLETALKSCGVEENFILINDISLGVRPVVELNRDTYAKISSKLSFSYQGRLYGAVNITGKRPIATDILKEESESWRAFENELRFIAANLCHWHSHPNIIKYHGLAILKEEDGGCVPYLLSERVEWNLLSLLEDRSEEAYLSQRFKVSIVHDIASGLKFLHSRRPRAIVHAALNSSSVLIDDRRYAKLTDFFHAGYAGNQFTITSKSHKLPKCSSEMKLHTSFDMLCLGAIVKAIDADVNNRERVVRDRNILKKFYVLCDSENGPPQDLTACEVSRRLADYLENPNQSPPLPQQQEEEQQPSVSFQLSSSYIPNGIPLVSLVSSPIPSFQYCMLNSIV
jgi:serine/threonine protein kinase